MAMCDVDRISALPDTLIHQIFSTMDTREVVHTILLSKRWKQLWKFSPFLNFRWTQPSQKIKPHLCTLSQKIKAHPFMEFVTRVMLLRGASSIKKFAIVCSEGMELDTSRVYSWLLAALERNAGELHLLVENFEQPFELPRQLFTSEVTIMQIMKATLCAYDQCPIKLPNSMCVAPRITSLRLSGVILPKGQSDGELLITCPVLNYLSLSNCDGRHLKQFIISTFLLESLCLLSGNLWRKDPCCKINICCPNLKSLRYHGLVMYEDYAFGNFLGLDSADVYVIWILDVEYLSKRMINFFRGIQAVDSLTLRSSSKKFLADYTNQFEVFPNLKLLKLFSSSTSAFGLANFLERSHQIESFIWDRSYGCYEEKEEKVWVLDLPIQSEFRCLKAIEIRHAYGNETELKILQILLLKAKVLEHVIVTTNRVQTEFAEKLSNFARASSSVSISCHSLS